LTGSGQAVLCSAERAPYRWIGGKMEGHHAVNHARREFVRGQCRVNTLESFFGLFKRAICGTLD